MVYDHDVVYGSVGGGADAVDALAHQIAMVLGGDDDGDARSLLEGIAGFKEIERFSRANGAFHVTALQMALQYRGGGRHHFVGPVMTRRAGVCAPLVQNFRQMNDGLCLFGCAQNQIVVLRYFQLLVKTTERA